MVGILSFIVVFGVLVTVHELGHLYFAKRAGIYCPEFAIGMGPKLFSYSHNDTLYTIRLLPVGGYVRMASADMEVNPLNKGMSIALKLNDSNEITHVLLDDKHNFNDIEAVEVIDNDFVEKMTVTANRYSDNNVVTYTLAKTAYLVENGQLERIASYDERFESKTPWQRFLTLFAGPLFNFLLAFVLFIFLAYVVGKTVDTPIVGEVSSGSPAEKAGIVVGDEVKEVNGQVVSDWTEMTQTIAANGGEDKPITFKVENDGNVREVDIVPMIEETETPTGDVEKRLIIGVRQMMAEPKNIFEPILWGTERMIEVSTMLLTLLGQLFLSIFQGEFTFDMLNGPVGIYKVTESVAQLGIISLIAFTAMISVNLGVMNLLPIPALDGGRILFVLYEAIFRKPVNKKVAMNIQIAGVLFVIMIMILVTWNDIKVFFLGG